MFGKLAAAVFYWDGSCALTGSIENGRVQLQRFKTLDPIRNCHRLRRELFHEVIAAFIVDFMSGREHLSPHFQPVVNA